MHASVDEGEGRAWVVDMEVRRAERVPTYLPIYLPTHLPTYHPKAAQRYYLWGGRIRAVGVN